MPKDALHATGLIGPNAILQYLPVLEQLGGCERRDQILARAGIFNVPDGSVMIPEHEAWRLHHQVRLEEPMMAPRLEAEAGKFTADYILANRIPPFVQKILKVLPSSLAARMVSKAIAQHAWTFVGSGRFRAVSPWQFEITDNPLVQHEQSDLCLCNWHAAVFQRLYQKLVAPDVTCIEVTCGAQTGHDTCRFVLTRP